ncbi:penicillin-binding transpeptidase domain-containing protein [Escherichia coli]
MVVDRFSGEVGARVVVLSRSLRATTVRCRRVVRLVPCETSDLSDCLSQPKILSSEYVDCGCANRAASANGQVWSPQNDDRRYSESGRVMLVDALTRSMNVPTVNLGMALGLPAVRETWIKLGVPKRSVASGSGDAAGALNLTPIEVAQAFQTIASGGNRAPLSALRSVIAEDGKVLYQSFPQAERAVPAQAAYLTLWTMQQVVQRGTASAWRDTRTCIWQGKQGLPTIT